ncbi:SCO family protein [Pararhodospirillum photometricum]|uniref:Electron transport protein SCO1/SenC n=1 Tax=Pararhodospirillum photometricum DSM 122 TaxID=1150469 RepID=H6SQR8_PARPM|nr:SCO family protein [Pararhodospirillum photometricum]CCG07383.1 Electron transport protein SCO1/SenC [Pararhodospirillum photometricum DSM 122]
MSQGRLAGLARRLGGAVFALLVLFGVAFAGRAFLLPGFDLGPQTGIGGPFTLVDGSGTTVTEKTYAGRFLLVFFGYTFCPDVCPTDLAILGRTLDLLPPEARGRVAPLFISVDPERDTPESVSQYAKAFHPALIGLTGTPEQVAAVTRAYRAQYQRVEAQNGGVYTIDHSAYTYLMGPDGRFLAHFEHATRPETMAAVLRKVMGLPAS